MKLLFRSRCFSFVLSALLIAVTLAGCGGRSVEEAHLHTYSQTEVAPSCQDGGYTLFSCECGDNYREDETAALGHEYSEWATVLEPTYEAEGQKERKCLRCNSSLSESIPKLKPHEHICTEEIVSATCTEKGVSRQVCQDCGLVVTESEIEELGHSWSSWEVTKEPTTTETGTKTRTCKNCGKVEVEMLPQKPEAHKHSFKETVVEPTCTEGGHTLRQCDCGEVYKTNETSKRGHLYGDWTTTKMPTTTEAGERQCVCSRCGQINKETVAKLDTSAANKYENYIDPGIEIRTNGSGAVLYSYCSVRVVDSRTWGDPPTIRINHAGGFDVTYYKQDGTKTSYTLTPVDGYVNQFIILKDGSYSTQLFGDYKD